MKPENRFYEAAEMLTTYENLLLSVPKNISEAATEIRVRAGKPIIIETPYERYICGNRQASTSEIYTCIKGFCDYSIHSCQRELSEGWITLKGGHRAGFTGTAHIRDGKIETIKDISSLNIRISREHKGVSDEVFSAISKSDSFRGMIIAGPPLSGKTTFLRDLCRNIGAFHKVAIVDERGEIAASYKGIPQNDVGLNTDILNCFTKNEGIDIAVRVLSPEYLICDEAESNAEAIVHFRGNGVKPIITMHCGDLTEASLNPSVCALINLGMINYVLFLDKGKNIGQTKGLWCVNNGKDFNSCNNSNNLLYNGYCHICKS